MSEMRVRRRVRMKAKQSKALRARLEPLFPGTTLWPDDAAVETADLTTELGAVLADGHIVGLTDPEAGVFLSVRGLLKYRPTTRWVTVDMGAIRFVNNGADIMAPGITEADAILAPGDWCWIRDEKNHQPLAVGRCLMAGADMGPASSGKAVASVHFLGDKIWDLEAA